MNDLLDWFRLEELFPIIALAGLLAYIGGELASPDAETYRRARRVTAAVFLLYAGMGIYTWGAIAASDVFVITLRALLAAGMAYGLSLLTLAPLAFVIAKLKAFARSRVPTQPEPRPETQAPTPVLVIHDTEEERRMERERASKIDDAKEVACQFYEEHAEQLREALPRALFKTKVRTSFVDGISPGQAWQAAQDLIAGMLPLIAQAGEKERAEKAEEHKREEQSKEEERKQQDAQDKSNAISRITEWYHKEKANIEGTMPNGEERSELLLQLLERYDQLVKDSLAEVKP